MKKHSLFLLLALLVHVYAGHAQPAQQRLSSGLSRRIDTLLTRDIEGIKQVLEIKTDDATKPVLLFLAGGPGSSMMPAAKGFTTLLKAKFTLVQWDQRGAGKTLALNPSPAPTSVAQMQRDTYHVVRFLAQELHQDKIYLVGSSWGNVLGFYMVEHHPELLHAYFAVNPVVSQLASEQELLAVLRTYFRADPRASQELAGVTIPFEKDEDLFYLRKWLFYKDGQTYVTSEAFKKGFLQWSATWSPVWNEVMAIDLPKTLKRVHCPVYFFVGQHDIQTSARITQNYFQTLNAPRKGLVVFEQSGHQIHKDEPEKFQKAILQTLETNR
ncbi:alpha/beta hydrolase [Hymenobacter amundsenii]|uniref:Alpha/beta hydrolase n=1 Tax=Hymenobacter amundsenii TaxID=2006685 RepID=A0A246FG15_9BACT|nr:alpha/beta hydrolase [Hymenobacter amundsenii]OWP61466.1 alpha/beta hydrolase [Hymenobacter amundsenii]